MNSFDRHYAGPLVRYFENEGFLVDLNDERLKVTTPNGRIAMIKTLTRTGDQYRAEADLINPDRPNSQYETYTPSCTEIAKEIAYTLS